MKAVDPTYTCDTPDCKSRCGISIEEDKDAKTQLERRGWVVVPQDGGGEKHFCPGCVAFGKAPQPKAKAG